MNLFFDTETSGLPAKGQYDNPRHPQTPYPVEIAALLTMDDGTIIEGWQCLVKPDGWEISRESTNVHGISHEKAVAEGISMEEALTEFRRLSTQADTMIAHNIKYDLLVLRGMCIRLFGKDTTFPGKNLVCTMLETTDMVKSPAKWGGYKWPKLDEAYQHFFNAPIRGAHRAMTDVEHTFRLFYKYRYDKDLPLPSDSER